MRIIVALCIELWARIRPDVLRWIQDLIRKEKEKKIDEENVEQVKKDIENAADREKRKEDTGKLLNGDGG